MRKTLWNQQTSAILGTKNLAMPLQESWRILSQIDGYVEHRPSQTTDQFHFRVRRPLVMQASNYSYLCRVRMIDLTNRLDKTCSGQLARTEKPREKTSGVT